MTKDWDASLKLLISDSPEDFAAWIFEGTYVQVKEKLSTEFTGQKLEADALLDIILDGEEALLHEVFTTLESTGKDELIPVAFTLASLAFGKDNLTDQEWLERTFAMSDILKETPIYKVMTREAREEGLQEGLQEGRQQGRQQGLQQGLQQALLGIVAERFPRLIRLAKKQIAVIEEPELLQLLVVKVSVAQTAEEAKQYLLEVDEGEEDE